MPKSLNHRKQNYFMVNHIFQKNLLSFGFDLLLLVVTLSLSRYNSKFLKTDSKNVFLLILVRWRWFWRYLLGVCITTDRVLIRIFGHYKYQHMTWRFWGRILSIWLLSLNNFRLTLFRASFFEIFFLEVLAFVQGGGGGGGQKTFSAKPSFGGFIIWRAGPW